MTTPEAEIAIAGLRIPADLAPRIIAALRQQYASVIGDRDDEGVVRAVLLWIIESSLETYEAQQAASGLDEAVARVHAEHTGKAAQAREKARGDAKRIREEPSGAAEPNMPKPAKRAAKAK